MPNLLAMVSSLVRNCPSGVFFALIGLLIVA
jgi:hypothetical protein